MKYWPTLGLLPLFAGVAAFSQDDLEAALKKFAEVGSYSFKAESKTESDNERFGGAGTIKAEGKYEKDVGMSASTDTIDVIRVGKKTVSRSKPIWRVEPDEEDWRRGPRTAGFRGPMSWSGRFVRAPHEELAAWDLRNIKREEKEKVGGIESAVFSADLAEDACKVYVPFGWMLDRMGGSADLRGSVKVYLDGDGQPVQYVADISCSLNFNGNDVSIKIKRTVQVSNIGATKVEIPDDVKRLLEKEKEPGKDEDR